VEKDEEKELYHLETAAIGGHPYARHNLACYESRNGNMERSLKHLIIATNLGCNESMQLLEEKYKNQKWEHQERDFRCFSSWV
jgi:hypothetical protein